MSSIATDQNNNNAAKPAPAPATFCRLNSQIGHFIDFQVSTNRITAQHRAANITPVRSKQTARVESTKGDYGFISFKVEERDHQASLSRNGAQQLPQNTGNLFFHSSELVSCHMSELEVGDLVEFNVVHNKRTNKYCAAKVRFIEHTKPEEKSSPDQQLEATAMTSLPGVKKTLLNEMRKLNNVIENSNNNNQENNNNINNHHTQYTSNDDNMQLQKPDTHNNSTPSTPNAEDPRPDRLARFKKTSITAESLLRTDSQTSRQPTTGNTECKVSGVVNNKMR